ncbi:MAG: Ppx/GppA family phosphatase [Phycisphaerae bacterium]|nr:Ppx/GppA family phosphatase [Phycisphaerae bacterium]
MDVLRRIIEADGDAGLAFTPLDNLVPDDTPLADAAKAPMKLGAIDVGTNSIHLVMAEISPQGDFHVLGTDKDMVQLGKGGFQDHILTDDAINKGIEALKRFLKMAELKGVTKIKAVATSAVREARNGGEFVDRAAAETGLDLRVITSEEEGRLIYLGVRHAVDLGRAENLIIDIGGGSVEFIVGSANCASLIHSVKLGGSRMAELFIRSDPPRSAEIKALRRHIQRQVAPLYDHVRTFPAPLRCIGTSGAIKSLAVICAHLRGASYDEESTQLCISHEELKPLLAVLTGTTRAERLEIPGMDARRVDACLPAATLLHLVMKSLRIPRIEYCDFALREGVIVDYIGSHRRKLQARATWPNPRMRSVVQLAERCNYRREHADQVARLAGQLFDQLQPLHQMDGRFKELLVYAALLHDVGYMISQRGHHKHSYYLIRNGELKGFTDQEIEIIANIARYHRKERPKKPHFSYQQLDPVFRKPVRKLAVILRVANALDRTHYSVIRDIDCRIGDGVVVIEAVATLDAELELYTTRRHERLFSREFGARLEVRIAGQVDAGLEPVQSVDSAADEDH